MLLASPDLKSAEPHVRVWSQQIQQFPAVKLVFLPDQNSRCVSRTYIALCNAREGRTASRFSRQRGSNIYCQVHTDRGVAHVRCTNLAAGMNHALGVSTCAAVRRMFYQDQSTVTGHLPILLPGSVTPTCSPCVHVEQQACTNSHHMGCASVLEEVCKGNHVPRPLHFLTFTFLSLFHSQQSRAATLCSAPCKRSEHVQDRAHGLAVLPPRRGKVHSVLWPCSRTETDM